MRLNSLRGKRLEGNQRELLAREKRGKRERHARGTEWNAWKDANAFFVFLVHQWDVKILTGQYSRSVNQSLNTLIWYYLSNLIDLSVITGYRIWRVKRKSQKILSLLYGNLTLKLETCGRSRTQISISFPFNRLVHKKYIPTKKEKSSCIPCQGFILYGFQRAFLSPHRIPTPHPLLRMQKTLLFIARYHWLWLIFSSISFSSFSKNTGKFVPRKTLSARKWAKTQNSFSFRVHVQNIVSDSLFLEFPGLTLFPCF